MADRIADLRTLQWSVARIAQTLRQCRSRRLRHSQGSRAAPGMPPPPRPRARSRFAFAPLPAAEGRAQSGRVRERSLQRLERLAAGQPLRLDVFGSPRQAGSAFAAVRAAAPSHPRRKYPRAASAALNLFGVVRQCVERFCFLRAWRAAPRSGLNCARRCASSRRRWRRASAESAGSAPAAAAFAAAAADSAWHGSALPLRREPLRK